MKVPHESGPFIWRLRDGHGRPVLLDERTLTAVWIHHEEVRERAEPSRSYLTEALGVHCPQFAHDPLDAQRDDLIARVSEKHFDNRYDEVPG